MKFVPYEDLNEILTYLNLYINKISKYLESWSGFHSFVNCQVLFVHRLYCIYIPCNGFTNGLMEQHIKFEYFLCDNWPVPVGN